MGVIDTVVPVTLQVHFSKILTPAHSDATSAVSSADHAHHCERIPSARD